MHFLYSIKILEDKLNIGLPTKLTLQKTTRMIEPQGAVDHDNPMTINIKRDRNY